MKLETVTKLYKGKTATSKNMTMMLCRKIMTPFAFFQLMANLEQFGSQIPEVGSLKLTLSLLVIFYLKKTENKTKKSLTQLSYYFFE